MFRVYIFRKETFNEAHFNYMRERKAITQRVECGSKVSHFSFLLLDDGVSVVERRMGDLGIETFILDDALIPELLNYF